MWVSAGQEKMLGNKRVLLVSDDKRALNFMTISLQVAGYSVSTSTNAEDALMKVESELPQIVVLDINISVEVIGEMRGLTKVPIIALSTDDSVAAKTITLGANQFMSKPFGPDDLVTRVRELLQ